MMTPLTSINVSKRTLAVEAVDELLQLIEAQDRMTPETRSREIRIGTKLVLRESVADKQAHTERQGIQ